MKVRFIAFVVIIMFIAIARAADPAPAPAPGTPFTHANGEDVLIKLQGENHDTWVVSFFQPGDNKDEVKEQIVNEMKKKFPDDTFQYGEVSLTAGYEYQKLYETLDLVGEPKRGHTTPQVLVMKDGEGYVIYGPKIGEAVAKRYLTVKNASVYGTPKKPTKR